MNTDQNVMSSNKKKVVNLCSFGHPDLSVAGVFDDSILSVAHLVRLCGSVPVISRNTIDPGALNILWGAGAHHSPPFASLLQHCNEANTIIFNMEQIDSSSPLVSQEYLKFLTHFRVLDYSVHNIRALRKSYPLIRAEEFPLLPAPEFCHDHEIIGAERSYHFAFYGSMNQRRQSVLEHIQAHGVRIKIIGGMYGKQLSKELLECHAVLNIHAYETSVFESARALRPMAMGMPMVSEISHLPQLIDWGSAPIKFVEYDALASCCVHAAQTGFAELRAQAQAEPEFLYRHHRNPALLSSVRYLLGLD